MLLSYISNVRVVLEWKRDLPLPTAAYTIEDQQRMSAARHYFAWQGRLVRRAVGRRVIEVGCGVGNFTGLLLDGEMGIALDIEPDCIAALRSRYADRANLHAFVADATRPEFPEYARFGADSCVCLNVLEHIEDDRAALRRMASVLTPGGVSCALRADRPEPPPLPALPPLRDS